MRLLTAALNLGNPGRGDAVERLGTRIHGREGDDQFCANAELDLSAALAVGKSQSAQDGEDVLVSGAGDGAFYLSKSQSPRHGEYVAANDSTWRRVA